MFLKIQESIKSVLLNNRRIVLFVAIAAIPLLFLYYYYYSQSLGYNSDYAVVLFMADSILKGNIFLRDWMISTVNGYTTWMPLNVLGVFFFGVTENTIHIVSALCYLIFSYLVIYCGIKSESKKSNPWHHILISSVLILIPTQQFARAVIRNATHTNAYIYLLVAIIILDKIDNQKESKLQYFFYFLLIAVANFSDDMVLFCFIIPATITFIIAIIGNTKIKKYKVLLGTTVGAAILSILMRVILNHYGYFSYGGVS